MPSDNPNTIENAAPLAAAILSLGELAWGRGCGPDPRQLPFLVWRYEQPNPERDARIVATVESFAGRVKWCVSQGGRRRINWSLMPEPARAFTRDDGFQDDVVAMQAFEERYPDIVADARADVPALAAAIRAVADAQ